LALLEDNPSAKESLEVVGHQVDFLQVLNLLVAFLHGLNTTCNNDDFIENIHNSDVIALEILFHEVDGV
jgi:hypothetical protein